MKSESIGKIISEVEVLNISRHGFWLLVGTSEYFLDFESFPWFANASIKQLCAVELHHGDHLYWPEIDVDLDLDRVQYPQKYPLLAKVAASEHERT